MRAPIILLLLYYGNPYKTKTNIETIFRHLDLQLVEIVWVLLDLDLQLVEVVWLWDGIDLYMG